MTDEQILEIVKYNLGLSTDVRDPYLLQIIKSARGELKRSGIDPSGQNDDYGLHYDMYLADYSAWLYRERGGATTLPKYLSFRRNNLIVDHK